MAGSIDSNLERAVSVCRDRGIIIPTFEELADPDRIPPKIKDELSKIGLWDMNARNLFRITWKNEPIPRGGKFGKVNRIVLTPALTGVRARIVALIGKWFPTGAHKVGATFGCIVPSLVSGGFDPTRHHAVWPSTGNYCRGGAYVASLLGCSSIAILPEGMSRERFEWLSEVAGEVIATPGSESNVKEIFDKCMELERTRTDLVVFNQFDEPGNHLWHYAVTGGALEEIIRDEEESGFEYSGIVLSSGSSGTLGSAEYLKELHPGSKVAVGEALQCPTLLLNGFGAHRIEGIGDKHVPWIHNLRNTDLVIGVDDENVIRTLRLFNEPLGREFLLKQGAALRDIENLGLLGISSIGNLIAAVKYARYFELSEEDTVLTVFTDSMELYGSRLSELESERGRYSETDAVMDYERLKGIGTDSMTELDHYGRKRLHNLKYYTWIEQQGRDLEELNRQWYDHRAYWGGIHGRIPEIDRMIRDFNERVGIAL
jgi:cysteine synthase